MKLASRARGGHVVARHYGMKLFELTRQLIDIPSPSGEEERVGRFLAAHLSRLGYHVELQEIAAGRANLIARGARAPRLVFSTHMDCVPPHIPASEDEEYLYGRGACDAKGIIAAQVEAAEGLRASGVEDVGLLFTVDEELGSLGARAANEHPLAASCRYLINGEPTGNLLATGSKGSLRVRLRTRGRAAHSAYPEEGESAIEKLLDLLEEVRRVRWPVNACFGETTCNIGVIAGGTRSNVIPAEAEAQLHLRLTTDSAPVRLLLDELARRHDAEVELLSVSEPVRLVSLEGFAQTVVRFTTDIAYLPNWGAPLLLGAGSILDAHTPHERVRKSELAESVALYERLARRLLAQADESLAGGNGAGAALEEKVG